uniref:Uncharacterized protein n=1 Tax=Ditylenchus dipsaci TaxID=166011 RepID=A0A915EL55_9BILA
MRHRYMKCTHKKDVRKCPKESVMCKNLAPLQIQRLRHKSGNSAESTTTAPKPLAIGECRAVRDALGRKHCPYGMRLMSGGRREYCAKPVDC